jgi:hypothetical protein
MIINPSPPPISEITVHDHPVRTRHAPDRESDFGRLRADELNATEHRWHVIYGPGSRSFWAFPLWDPGASIVLEDVDPYRLRRLMRETEARHTPR